MAEPQSERWFIAPYFLVPDVVSAAHFYRDTLGFSFDRFWGEPPSCCMVQRGGVVIMLAQVEDKAVVRPNNLAQREGGAWDAYVWVPDADALHAAFLAKGATIARGLCDQPYGCRDFDVLDCNGIASASVMTSRRRQLLTRPN
jgi:uncharacterized glyoxalase superfamily protein PhnB